jgi:Heme exporter protein D (CcmD)
MLDAPHIGFVIAAYAIATAVIGAMIGSVVFEYRRLTAELGAATDALEAARNAGRAARS